MNIENDPLLGPLEKEQRKRMCLTFNLRNMNLDGKYGKKCSTLFRFISFDSTLYITANLDDLNRRDMYDNSLSAGITSSSLIQNSSAPVNIPGSTITNSISGNYSFMNYVVNCLLTISV